MEAHQHNRQRRHPRNNHRAKGARVLNETDPIEHFFKNSSSEAVLPFQKLVEKILECISPVDASEEKRRGVTRFMRKIIAKSLGFETAVVGSCAQKTYLPDSDIDLTVFHAGDTNWYTILIDALIKSAINDKEGEANQIRNVEFVNADIKLVKCLIDNVHVDVSENKLNNVAASAFIAHVDQFLGKDHLFLRSVLIIKTWCRFDSTGFVQEPILASQKSKLSSYCVSILVLHLFNVFDISHPLEAFTRFFRVYAHFDWKRMVATIDGPVPISEMHHRPLRYSPHYKTRLPPKLIAKYAVKYSAKSNETKEFQIRNLNVLDPLDEFNNIGRSVNRAGIYKVNIAFSEAEKWLQLIFYHLFYSASVKEDTGNSPEWPEGLRCAKQLFHSSLNQYTSGDGFRDDLLDHPCAHWVWKPRTNSEDSSKKFSTSQHKVAGTYVPVTMTDKTCKHLHDKWKACAALCKTFKVEQKQHSRGRASKTDHKSLRARSPSPNPDSIRPPAFHSPDRGRGMPLVSSGSTSEAPPQPLFPKIRFGDDHGFPVTTGGAAREGKEDVPQVQSLSVRVCMASGRRNLFELVKVREVASKQVTRELQSVQMSKEQKTGSSAITKTKTTVPSFKSVLSQPKPPRKEARITPLATRGSNSTADYHAQKHEGNQLPVSIHADTASKQDKKTEEVKRKAPAHKSTAQKSTSLNDSNKRPSEARPTKRAPSVATPTVKQASPPAKQTETETTEPTGVAKRPVPAAASEAERPKEQNSVGKRKKGRRRSRSGTRTKKEPIPRGKQPVPKKKDEEPKNTSKNRKKSRTKKPESAATHKKGLRQQPGRSISANVMYAFLFLLLLSGIGISYFFQGQIGIAKKSRPCSNFGFWSDGQCQCYRGKTGADCRTDPKPVLQDGTPFWITHNFNQRTLQGQESAQSNDPMEMFDSLEQEGAVPRHLWTMGGSPLNIGGSSGGLNRGRGFASTSAWFHRDAGYNFGGAEDAKSEVRHKHGNSGAAKAQRAPSSKYKRPMTSDNAVVQ